MGHMTIVSILNDGFDTIENHPDEFIKNIKAGMHGGFAIGNEKAVNSYPVGNYEIQWPCADHFMQIRRRYFLLEEIA